jgi:protein kinase C substrate 80K-H
VNDGICDCCDGADEWNSVAKGLCDNDCYAQGEESRKEAERMAKIQVEGFAKKQELTKGGKEMKESKRAEMYELQAELDNLRAEEAEREAAKKEAEEKEKVVLDAYNYKKEAEKEKREAEEKEGQKEMADETFDAIDADGNGIMSKEEMMQQNWLFDQNNDGTVTDEEATFFLSGNTEYTRDEFEDGGWLMIKHIVEEKKEQQEGGEGQAQEEGQEGVGSVEEVPLSERVPRMEGDDNFQSNDNLEDDDEDLEDEYDDMPDDIEVPEGAKRGSSLPPRRRPSSTTTDHNKEDYDDETRELVNKADAARSAYESLRGTVTDLENKIGDLRDLVDRDYGDAEEFAALTGLCFEYPDNEYLYKICPFDSATQSPKSGGGSTSLGNWDRWEDGYNVMKFTGGQSCWNGPSRSMTVTVQCGLETTVLSVGEPSKCEYVARMETPAACVDPNTVQDSAAGHDEL